MWPSVANELDSFFNGAEGSVLNMYPDILGYITTGTGYLIDSIPAAQALAWYFSDGSPASPSDVAAAWNAVDATRTAPKGQKQVGSVAMYGGASPQVKALTNIRLHEQDVHALFLQRMQSFENTLRRRVPGYDSLPADGQLLLLSMAWALGPNFNYPKFLAAINSSPPDFVTAGKEATWNNENSDRRTANALLAANAATVIKAGTDPSKLWYPKADVAAATGIVGIAILTGCAFLAHKVFSKRNS